METWNIILAVAFGLGLLVDVLAIMIMYGWPVATITVLVLIAMSYLYRWWWLSRTERKAQEAQRERDEEDKRKEQEDFENEATSIPYEKAVVMVVTAWAGAEKHRIIAEDDDAFPDYGVNNLAVELARQGKIRFLRLFGGTNRGHPVRQLSARRTDHRGIMERKSTVGRIEQLSKSGRPVLHHPGLDWSRSPHPGFEIKLPHPKTE